MTLKETLKIIENYKCESPHYNELLEILEEILILREEYRRKISGDIFNVDERLVEKKLAGGLPIVDFAEGNFDLSGPREYFITLLNVAKKRTPEEAEEILEQIDGGTLDYEEVVRDSFTCEPSDNGDEEDENTIFDLLGFLIEESLRPYLEILSEKFSDAIRKAQWSEGYCPICSREPKIGELKEEEGRRYLFCSQCGFEWNYKRVKCPFCGNEDQQSLAYFTIEGEEQYRVDVCNECNRYMKIVDTRKSDKQSNLDVEDIATLHLDILADEEGYE